MDKTNLGLVEFAKRALTEKWGYVWGTYGQVLTEAMLKSKISQYPFQVGSYQAFIRQNYLNKKTVDCIGLIKAYMWESDGKVTYNPVTDVNTGMMFDRATEKGQINTIPEISGVAVYKQGHIGVYIGSGQVIEAHNTSKGVIKTPLKGAGSTPWTHWLRIPYINYVEVKALKWDEIIKKVADNPVNWEKGITSIVEIAKTPANIGDLKILRFLPDLIEKIYRG